MRDYTKCPFCKKRLPAHKGHTKTFRELTNREKQRSIWAMTLNLRKAVRAYSNKPETILRTIRTFIK